MTAFRASPKTYAFGERVMRQRYLLLMLIPAIAYVGVFIYGPTWGMIIAFINYNPGLGIFKSPFVGLKYFTEFLTSSDLPLLLRNSFAISLLNIIFGTFFPVLFAVLLNEISSVRFKKTVQTISYLPHFISYVVVANIALTMLSPDGGAVNRFLKAIGAIKQPIFFFAMPQAFWWLIATINIWKEMGWAAIIYIAAIANIDPQLYEAAMADGAGRLRRIWHITLPGIAPTIVVLTILAVPDLLNAGFDPSFLLGNALVSDYSRVLDTHIYAIGIQQGRYSLATAIGLMRMAVGLVLILSANAFARRVSEYSLF
jgi:putative aldouronate transport system permease protein